MDPWYETPRAPPRLRGLLEAERAGDLSRMRRGLLARRAYARDLSRDRAMETETSALTAAEQPAPARRTRRGATSDKPAAFLLKFVSPWIASSDSSSQSSARRS